MLTSYKPSQHGKRRADAHGTYDGVLLTWVLLAWKRGDRNQAVQHIADHMVDALGLIGSVDECRAKVDAFVAAGVDMPIILPFTPESEPAPAYERTIAAFRASPSG